MQDVRHIVFDIGKVLVHYDPNIPFSRLIPDAAKRQWFFDTICTHEWNLEQDRGRTWEDAEAVLIESHPDQADNIRNFRKHWAEMIPHEYPESVAILEKLVENGHDVTLLTNWASDTFREARKRFGFLEKPRGVTVSGDIGLIKPDREIYDHHVEAFGLDPAASLFIDDSQKNVDAAIAAGWQAVLFTDADTLRRDLNARGISI